MATEIIASRKDARRTRDGYLVVESRLHRLGGNERPYFSVTAELWDSEGWYRNGQDGRCRAVGAMHEEILRAFPKLAPVVAVHLADDSGVPMHAVANGWYFYSGDAERWERNSPCSYPSDRTDPPKVRAARALRVAAEEIQDGLDKEGFAAFVESLRPRWQADAHAALAVLLEAPA